MDMKSTPSLQLLLITMMKSISIWMMTMMPRLNRHPQHWNCRLQIMGMEPMAHPLLHLCHWIFVLNYLQHFPDPLAEIKIDQASLLLPVSQIKPFDFLPWINAYLVESSY